MKKLTPQQRWNNKHKGFLKQKSHQYYMKHRKTLLRKSHLKRKHARLLRKKKEAFKFVKEYKEGKIKI